MTSISLGSNISSLRVQRRLGQLGIDASSLYEHLSSGLRITKASDDAAGLAIASQLNAGAQIRGQAIRNINDGVSYLNIADSAFAQLTNISIRHRELATQAANGTFSTQQRAALNLEAEQLSEEFIRILDSTEFNGIQILRNQDEVRIQAGEGESRSLVIAPLAMGNSAGGASEPFGGDIFSSSSQTTSSTFNDSEMVALHDFDGDGVLDLVTSGEQVTYFFRGNGDGTFAPTQSFSNIWFSGDSILIDDFNNDLTADVVVVHNSNPVIYRFFEGNGDGTFANTANSGGGLTFTGGASAGSADFNEDGNLDAYGANPGSGRLWVKNGLGTGFFGTSITISLPNAYTVNAADFNEDGNIDLIASTSNSFVYYTGNGSGAFAAALTVAGTAFAYESMVYDINGDNNTDYIVASDTALMIYTGNGNGTFSDGYTAYSGTVSRVDIADLDGDGNDDILLGHGTTARLLSGDGTGTFAESLTFQTTQSVGGRIGDFGIGDLNGDSQVDILVGGSTLTEVFLNQTPGGSGGSGLLNVDYDLTTRQGALNALDQIDTTMQQISTLIGVVGTSSARLEVALSNVRVEQENYIQAASRIMSVDVAEETAKLTSVQILQQVGASILANANQQPALALQLLR